MAARSGGMGRVEPECSLVGEACASFFAAPAPRTKSVPGRQVPSGHRIFCAGGLPGRDGRKLAQQARTRLDAHRHAGHQLILVTGAPDFLVVPLAEFLDVPTVFAAKPEQRDGVYTGALIPPLPYG